MRLREGQTAVILHDVNHEPNPRDVNIEKIISADDHLRSQTFGAASSEAAA
jgi:hypothetical protein